MAKTVKLADVRVSRFSRLTPADRANVERIRADLVDGSKMLLNDPHVFKDDAGKWELLAGHDRVEAALLAGWDEIQVRDFSAVISPKDDDAILAHFCKENLLRKETRKDAIAEEWITRHPEWTDGKVALESGCSREYVSQIRSEMQADGKWQPVATTVNAKGEERPARERRPRTVRQNVPSRRGIPHPTETKPLSKVEAMRADREAAAEEREQMAAERGEEEGRQESLTREEGGDSPEARPGIAPEAPAVPSLPAWLVAALAASGLALLPLTNDQAAALSAAQGDRLFAFGTACTNAARRAKLLRENAA